MLISAINAMTMTPARAAWSSPTASRADTATRARRRCRGGASPCSAGWRRVWLLTPILGAVAGPAGGRGARRGGARRPEGDLADVGAYLVLFLPGAVAGGVLGWFIIRPVNWVLGSFFRGFNWVFDRATQAYGKTVGWCLRLSAIVLLVYVGLIGLTGFGFTRVPSGFVPMPGQGLPAGEHPAARLGLAGAHGRGDRRGREDRPGDARRRPHARPSRACRSS